MKRHVTILGAGLVGSLLAILLRRRGYDWKDFHMEQGIAEQLGVAGLPTVLLVDSKGIVVYYQLGADNMKNLTEAIHKLGPQYDSASAD